MNPDDKKLVAKTLVDVQAYRDLDVPTIYTSGEIGIYYINTEKLAQDEGRWEDFAEDSKGMIEHCIAMMDKKPSFKAVIDIIAGAVREVFPENITQEKRAISGGQRRDWLFSGPVAHVLGLPHVSIHKDGSAYVLKDGELTPLGDDADALKDVHCVHVVDLLTKGLSVYNDSVSPASGWVVDIRKRGGVMSDLFSVVSRLQGGEENVESVGVTPHVFVEIDKEFLSVFSRFPERACSYLESPTDWVKNYIQQEGVDAFVPFFDPEQGKPERANKFITLYAPVLKASGAMAVLKQSVSELYGVSLHDER